MKSAYIMQKGEGRRETESWLGDESDLLAMKAEYQNLYTQNIGRVEGNTLAHQIMAAVKELLPQSYSILRLQIIL